MPNATLRANARTLPDDTRLRRRLAAAAERIIDALDALDAPDDDLEDSHDAELDPAEDGIADHAGYIEQCVGELSLGATLDVDQRVAWGPDRASSPVDGEATGTEDDIERLRSTEQWIADRKVIEDARAQGRELLRGIRRHRTVES